MKPTSENNKKKGRQAIKPSAPCGNGVAFGEVVFHSAIAAHLASKSDILYTSTRNVFLSFTIFPAQELPDVFYLVTVVLREIFLDFSPVDDICVPWFNFPKKMNPVHFLIKNLSKR